MRATFRGHYRPTKEDFSDLWKNCLFVLDANVLLNIYRYSPETRTKFLELLKKIEDDLWIPHQAAYEYQKNRLGVIKQQEDAYDEIGDFLKSKQGEIENKLNSFNKHPFINSKALLEDIDILFSAIISNLSDERDEHPKLIRNDDLREEITELLNGKVGSQCENKELDEIYEECKKRKKEKIPPGFKDESCGDFLIWSQILNKASDMDKSVIFVTDDKKEDWWWKFNGETLGPHTNLIDEFYSNNNNLFYMYTSNRFLECSRKYLNFEVDQEAIDEVKDLSKIEFKFNLLNEEKYPDILLQNRNEFNHNLAKYFNSKFHNNIWDLLYQLEEVKIGVDLIEDDDINFSKIYDLYSKTLKIKNSLNDLKSKEEELIENHHKKLWDKHIQKDSLKVDLDFEDNENKIKIDEITNDIINIEMEINASEKNIRKINFASVEVRKIIDKLQKLVSFF